VNIDPDYYLPNETYTWVSQQLSELEFDPAAFQNSNYDDRFALYHTTYMELRRRVRNHINLGYKSILGLLEIPEGVFDWNLSGATSVSTSSDRENIREMMLEQD
jgi:hypothetical protein